MSLTPVPSFEQLAADPARARELPPEAARDLLLQLAPLQEALRLQALQSAGANSQPEGPRDRLLSVKEAAQKLGLSEDHLYRHRGGYPFTVREGRRILFSERGIEDWIRRRQGR